MRERIEQRVLGALRLVDRVSQVPLQRALTVRAEGGRLVRNAGGLYVITAANGLEAHSAAFTQPPATPAPGSVNLSVVVSDPQMRYLPRLLNIRLPRDADPASAGQPDSLFTPRQAQMYPASTATIATNWSAVRASVTRAGEALAGCLLRVVDEAEGGVLASGISDERGEALVVVPGVPITKFAGDDDEEEGEEGDDPPVMITTLAVRLEASAGDGSWPVDPDLLEQNHAANIAQSRQLTLKTGRVETVAINLT